MPKQMPRFVAKEKGCGPMARTSKSPGAEQAEGRGMFKGKKSKKKRAKPAPAEYL